MRNKLITGTTYSISLNIIYQHICTENNLWNSGHWMLTYVRQNNENSFTIYQRRLGYRHGIAKLRPPQTMYCTTHLTWHDRLQHDLDWKCASARGQLRTEHRGVGNHFESKFRIPVLTVTVQTRPMTKTHDHSNEKPFQPCQISVIPIYFKSNNIYIYSIFISH